MLSTTHSAICREVHGSSDTLRAIYQNIAVRSVIVGLTNQLLPALGFKRETMIFLIIKRSHYQNTYCWRFKRKNCYFSCKNWEHVLGINMHCVTRE
jgi:hypothetical protein